MSLCPRFLTTEDTLSLCVMCLGGEFAHSVLEASECARCENFFSRDEGQASVSRSSGPPTAEAQCRLRLWGSEVELAEKFKKGMDLLKASAASLSGGRDPDTLSLGLSDPVDSAIFLSSESQGVDVVSDSDNSVSTEFS